MSKYQEHKVHFKKGDILGLDNIYNIQGHGITKKGQWWEHYAGIDRDGNPQIGETFNSADDVIITRDIKITVTIEE